MMNTEYTFDDDLVSDFHKDAYGFRPSDRGDGRAGETAASRSESQPHARRQAERLDLIGGEYHHAISRESLDL